MKKILNTVGKIGPRIDGGTFLQCTSKRAPRIKTLKEIF